MTLSISPVVSEDKESGFVQSYFAFVGIGKDKIKSGERIELEARLDELHWYSSRASVFIVSEKPNLSEIGRIFPGTYRLTAVADIKPKE